MGYFELGRYFIAKDESPQLKKAVRNFLIFKVGMLLTVSHLKPENIYLYAHCYGEHAKIYSSYGLKKVGQFINDEGKEEFVLRIRGDDLLKGISLQNVNGTHLKNMGVEHSPAELRIDGELSEMLWPYTFGKVNFEQSLEVFTKILTQGLQNLLLRVPSNQSVN